jgi:hypothetical protein
MNKIGISLGNACPSAEWAIHNNIRKRKSEGYKTCPFDLMVSNYKGIVQCINNDFEDFCNPDYLVLNNDGLFNVKYGFGFNHETPGHADLYLHENWPEGQNHFINNNYKHFIARYNKRIQSFRDYLDDPNNYIIFIIQFSISVNPNDDCKELRNALKNKYPNLKYEIKVI